MKMRKLILLTILFLAVTAQADVTVFDANTTINSGDYDYVVATGANTVINVTGGTINRLVLASGAELNMSDGAIDGTDSAGGLVLYGPNSIANISGGTITASWAVNCYGNSEVVIDGNTIITGHVRCYKDSYLEVSGNASIYKIQLFDDSSLVMTGGTVEHTNIEGFSGSVQLSGGSIALGSIRPPVDTEIQVVGYGLAKVPYGGTYGLGQVTGNWNDDSVISLNFEYNHPYPYVYLYDGCLPGQCMGVTGGDLNGDCTVNLEDFAIMADNWLQ